MFGRLAVQDLPMFTINKIEMAKKLLSKLAKTPAEQLVLVVFDGISFKEIEIEETRTNVTRLHFFPLLAFEMVQNACCIFPVSLQSTNIVQKTFSPNIVL